MATLLGCERQDKAPAAATVATTAAPTVAAAAPMPEPPSPVDDAVDAGAGAAAAPAPPPVEHDARLVRRLVDAYEVVRRALGNDDFEGAKRHAIAVGLIASEARRETIFAEIVDAARNVTEQRAIAGSRTWFAVLSRRLLGVVHDTPLVAGSVRAFRCRDVDGYGKWLQLEGDVSNPYLGAAGVGCADAVPVEP